MGSAPSPVRGALLGLLLERPGYGYELAQRLNSRTGSAWRLSPSSVYAVLDGLESGGLVRREIRGLRGRARQRERVMYYATEDAQAEFQRWLGRPPQTRPVRAELLMRIAVARPGDVPVLVEALEAYERECFATLKQDDDFELVDHGTWDALLTNLVDSVAKKHLRAELEWVVFARRRIAELAAGFGRD